MYRTGIYALDQNSWTGWAVERIGGPPLYGSQHFQRKNSREAGAQGLAFMKWLRRELEFYGPERLIYEAPLPPMRQSQTTTATVTMGFAYVIEVVCSALKIPVVCVSQGTWSKAFTGNGKRDSNTKGRVLNECARRGFDPPDDNASDAIGILAYAVGLYHGRDQDRMERVGNLWVPA